jgi:myo-inositol-1(or 4)-monophosphatase
MQQPLNFQLLTQSVKEVGQLFLADFRHTAVPQTMDELMEALISIESRCFDALHQRIDVHYPDIPWIDDDEFTADSQRQPANHDQYWLCDTMDGAIQYLQHISGWTINLVLIQQGQPSFSVIYDPLTDELFWAAAGVGAFLNGQRVKVGAKQSTSNMVAVWEYGHQLRKDPAWKEKTAAAVTALLDKFGIVRNYGPHGLQLAYLGAGRIDLFLQWDLDTHNWLAGMLIAREAGAMILSMEGDTWQWGQEGLLAGTANAIGIYLHK